MNPAHDIRTFIRYPWIPAWIRFKFVSRLENGNELLCRPNACSRLTLSVFGCVPRSVTGPTAGQTDRSVSSSECKSAGEIRAGSECGDRSGTNPACGIGLYGQDSVAMNSPTCLENPIRIPQNRQAYARIRLHRNTVWTRDPHWSCGRSSVVEHNLAMVGVVSSSLIARSKIFQYQARIQFAIA